MAPREEPRTVYPSRTGVLYAPGSRRRAQRADAAAASRARIPDRRAAARPIGWGAWRTASTSAPPRGTRASPPSRSARSTPSPGARPASACSGRSRVRPRIATTCSTCCSRTTASCRSSTRRRSASRYDEVHADPDQALATIVRRFKAVEDRCDAVVIIGSDFTDVGSPTELGYNARIAANLGAPVLLVLGGRVGQGRGARSGSVMRRRARPTSSPSSPSSRSRSSPASTRRSSASS